MDDDMWRILLALLANRVSLIITPKVRRFYWRVTIHSFRSYLTSNKHTDIEAETRWLRENRDKPYFNTGVIAWRQCAETKSFFDCWNLECDGAIGCEDQYGFAKSVEKSNISLLELPPTLNYYSGKVSGPSDVSRMNIGALHFWGEEKQRMGAFI